MTWLANNSRRPKEDQYDAAAMTKTTFAHYSRSNQMREQELKSNKRLEQEILELLDSDSDSDEEE